MDQKIMDKMPEWFKILRNALSKQEKSDAKNRDKDNMSHAL